MMIQPTEKERELYRQLERETDKEKRVQIFNKIVELSKEQDKELDNCPFVH